MKIKTELSRLADGAALILGGGGAKGLSHIGVLRYLEEKEIQVNSITGTSIGALLGGLYASGKTVAEIEEIALKIDLKQVVNLFSPTISKSGITSGKKVEEYLFSLFGDVRIEGLKIPYKAVSTDINTGNEVIIDGGRLVDAVRASISIPLVFEPVVNESGILVDGGLVNPLPVNIAWESYEDPIIAVNVINKPQTAKPAESNKKNAGLISLLNKLDSFGINSQMLKDQLRRDNDVPGAKKIMMRSTEITQTRIIELTMKLYKPDIYIEPEVREYTLFDFHKGKEIIERGYSAVETIFNSTD